MSPVVRQAYLGLARTIAGMAALLFLPAWSLLYVQGWIFLAVLALFSLIIIHYFSGHDESLLKRRMKNGPADETRPSQKFIQTVTAVFGLALVVIPGLDWRRHWSDVPLALNALGFGGIVLGFAIVFLVFRENSFASGVVEVAVDQKVISSGPYSHVRYPMYVGACLLFLSTPLALGSYWAMIPAVVECAMIIVRLLDEERFLHEALPGYTAYCKKVRDRLLPGLW
ncbi:MAG: isoprenylcysteine carboxylmethyltransferase family protein [Xanthobacteraceae bacterium]|nr:isoprenylcysteine carboxylmethyltransferase family protein [Xanthobacteraceae bacterium]